MGKLKTKVAVHNKVGQIKVHFYQNNKMPALMIEDDDQNLIDSLTTNYRSFVENSISIRSDESSKVRLLCEAGWIKNKIVESISSGFININYYQLSDEAIRYIGNKREGN